MAHGPEKRVALRAAYLSGLSLEQASIKASVPHATARRWKSDAQESGDDWDKLRGAALLTAGGGMEQAITRVVSAVVLQAEATIELLQASEGVAPLERTQAIASLTDSLNKAAAVAHRLMPATDRLAVAMDVVKRLGEFVRTRHPRHVAAFAEILEPFADELTRHG